MTRITTLLIASVISSAVALGPVSAFAWSSGIVGGGEYYFNSNHTTNTTTGIDVTILNNNGAAKGHVSIHTTNRLLPKSERFDSEINIECVKELGNGVFMISGSKLAGSRIAYVNNPASDGFFNGVADTAGDRIVGKLSIAPDGTAQRSDWTTGQEACWGSGAYAEVPAPASKARQQFCLMPENFVLIPDCTRADPTLFPLDRTIKPGGLNDTGSIGIVGK